MSKRTLLNYYSSSGSTSTPTPDTNENQRPPKIPRPQFCSSDIISDPGLRKPIDEYPFEIRDQVKRAYFLRGPTQPEGFTFPRTWQSGEWRSFQQHWLETYDWLEYSEAKDAAFCFYCYLFFEPGKPNKFGSNVFAKVGVEKWKKALEKFEKHGQSHSHAHARLKCDDFMNQRTSVSQKIIKTTKEEEARYKIRLTSSLDVARFLIMQGDAFRGHDESSTSLNKGSYREMVDWYKDKVEAVRDAYDKGSKNCQMLSSDIQKDLTKACAEEVMAVIMDEIRGRHFSVLIDESRDVSIKEQMAMILRFVNDEGKVMQRFIGIQHIEKCTSIALKEALVSMLSSHKLSISTLRGQGYDGASNMRGEFNGVQKLIHDENPYAFYVHCFAHQLQLVVVTVSTSTPAIADFFNYVPLIVNTVGASCMRKDVLLAKHHDTLLRKVENAEIATGRGLNQESSLARPGDTRWGSHLKTLLRILVMWEATLEMLEIVKKDSIKPTCNGGAFGLISKMESFDFVFILHLMIELLSITDNLSRALQRKDQDIVEAMHLIMGVKERLQEMRDNGWEPLFKRVKAFCDKNEIKVPNMDKEINARGTSTRRRQKVTNMHFYHVEIFLAAIDAILTEMNHRFSEVSSELLVCMAALNPRNSFSNFDVDKIVRLAEIYAEDFDIGHITVLPSQLREFHSRVRRNSDWLNDLMICYVEKEIFTRISNDKIIQRFEDMKKRRMLVPKNNLVISPDEEE